MSRMMVDDFWAPEEMRRIRKQMIESFRAVHYASLRWTMRFSTSFTTSGKFLRF